jgi:hypothetical protein
MQIKAWLKVIGLGITKIPLKILALFVVPFLNSKQRVEHPIFGVRDATDLSYKNIAIRNAVHNMYNLPDVPFITVANTDDHTLEKESGLQWRYRKSGQWIFEFDETKPVFIPDGKYVSFRVTWGKPRNKGKREFYIGWTMGSSNLKGESRMRLTFFQFRFW